jgi:hypothetical protein
MENNTVQQKKMPSEKDQVSKTNSAEIWSAQERESLRSRYGCEILKQNCTLEEAKDTQVPTDAYIVTYQIDNKVCYDLTRCGKLTNLFDMYYDNLGPVILSMVWGKGKINPKVWGYKAPEKKKRK